MKKVKTLLLFLILIAIVGCSNSNESDFEGSSSFPEFPIPVEAELAESREDGYEKYLYNAIGNNGGIREDYYEIIESWGWKIQEDLQMGSYYVFKKDGQFIGMTIHGSSEGDFFTISEHKNN
ncbi:hypothetical protein [Halalkalibacter urbisdiaboli]|uniref:hypothetical protein n=1 Tax=Halalkalibacter urbisdiaboli TaxID=1960589 RepID=UPI000B4449F4|nr:hypothetical protein [Halalkalibacter urbisdiaboli]